MNEKKLSVIFPGIGYHTDKPLLYFGTKLARSSGYDTVFIGYHDMPQKIRGDMAMMKKAALLAYEQSADQLKSVRFEDYDDVLFIGKSIGTVAMAKYASDNKLNVRQIWYTPVEATFSFASGNTVAFIGDADPWSDVDKVKNIAKDLGIKLYSYPECNHSLECGDVARDLETLSDVMRLSELFIKG
ncbi:MAG: alpha/beta hydrolase [Lachnospiraceae bacterium]|nr:alpha/beta hydrolase [Lachnospiraceae bacterium]